MDSRYSCRILTKRGDGLLAKTGRDTYAQQDRPVPPVCLVWVPVAMRTVPRIWLRQQAVIPMPWVLVGSDSVWHDITILKPRNVI